MILTISIIGLEDGDEDNIGSIEDSNNPMPIDTEGEEVDEPP